jgi:hypothetical protein
MGGSDHRGWASRWVAGALGGALLLGLLGARAVPPPPPFQWPHSPGRGNEEPPAPEPEPDAQAGGEPGMGPAMIWLLPVAGQLSSVPNGGE